MRKQVRGLTDREAERRRDVVDTHWKTQAETSHRRGQSAAHVGDLKAKPDRGAGAEPVRREGRMERDGLRGAGRGGQAAADEQRSRNGSDPGQEARRPTRQVGILPLSCTETEPLRRWIVPLKLSPEP